MSGIEWILIIVFVIPILVLVVFLVGMLTACSISDEIEKIRAEAENG